MIFTSRKSYKNKKILVLEMTWALFRKCAQGAELDFFWDAPSDFMTLISGPSKNHDIPVLLTDEDCSPSSLPIRNCTR